jgi:hypothetical protein
MDKPENSPEPMSIREYRKRLAALPPEAQQKHKNFMELMEAASRRDHDGIKQLFKKFRTQSPQEDL